MKRFLSARCRAPLVAPEHSLRNISCDLNFANTSVQKHQQHVARAFSWCTTKKDDRPSWSEEWKAKGLGAELVNTPRFPKKIMFVELGFGVDQHGEDNATKAAIRAVRNAIEFNSIPGVIEHIPGGRKEMMIHVKLGVPPLEDEKSNPMPVDKLDVAKVFPYGKLLPIEVVPGGLSFSTGRVVEELGDTNDKAVCVAACISIGYGDTSDEHEKSNTLHTTYNTKDGY